MLVTPFQEEFLYHTKAFDTTCAKMYRQAKGLKQKKNFSTYGTQWLKTLQPKFFDDPNAKHAGFGAEEDPAPEPILATQAREQVELQMWRDTIAQNMWEQYRHHLSRTR
ncbi:hypothetical protein PCANC_15318 [Puccinia coronata f. sp. avenae]|uniref:Uncharacterized protein n=1 Tax=Puccinia coronata f. sp. avenae TaxID=200324 RepID=A0A2N5S578_9BASI|nr:hypothetical protein PCANC_25218 [Puccinia coronata f. sp. avenae]PLW39328.1 hypothetical protein PCANC_15318 [Puccinia coronata f. sp. avenae]